MYACMYVCMHVCARVLVCSLHILVAEIIVSRARGVVPTAFATDVEDEHNSHLLRRFSMGVVYSVGAIPGAQPLSIAPLFHGSATCCWDNPWSATLIYCALDRAPANACDSAKPSCGHVALTSCSRCRWCAGRSATLGTAVAPSTRSQPQHWARGGGEPVIQT